MKILFKGLNVLLRITLLAAGVASLNSAAPAYAASIPPAVIFTPAVTGLTQPVFVTNAGDGSNRLFIVQQTGQIRIFKTGTGPGTGLIATPFLDVTGVSNFLQGGEQGLLGLAFDPNYASNGFFYVTYTTSNSPAPFIYTTTLVRYKVSTGNADVADTSTATVILQIPKKYSNHNGGMIAFGPDGYLYFSMGDGGNGGDPDGNAQNFTSLLGKLLRLDVHTTPPSGQTYVIPSTNPYFGSSTKRQEIWAYGLRNPWRFSFDRSTGDLFIGDVGQSKAEEVDYQAAGSSGGQNYGWNVREGNLCYNPSSNCGTPTSYVPPVTAYDHSHGCAVTGGYVYRGNLSTALQGVYFYGDYCSGEFSGLIKNPNNTWTSSLITDTPYLISSFGQDEQGELYLTDYGSGIVYHILSTTVNISGNIGAGGITLSYTDGTPKTVVSQPDGSYSFMVTRGWSGTVTPSQACYTFSPANRPYSTLNMDQTAQNYTYTINAGCAAGAGTYDNTSTRWTYSGTWVPYTSSGPYNNTDTYTSTIGNFAAFTFSGTKFAYVYAAAYNRGNVEIWVDGSLLTTLNTYNSAIVWQSVYTSPSLSPGTHNVALKFAGPAGMHADIDAIQINP